MRWGVLFVGCHGSTASTLMAGILNPPSDTLRWGSYWCAVEPDYPPEIYSIEVGGWDYRHSTLRTALVANSVTSISSVAKEPLLFPPIIGPSDYACRIDGIQPTHSNESLAIDCVRSHIDQFRKSWNLDRIIVVNTSSPMFCGEVSDLWSSTRAYAFATVKEGCDWVEFTPSDSITPDLIECSKSTGSRIAGRDGSTGQTITKLSIRDYLLQRGLHIEHWFSTNLIGNRDGKVLDHPDYNKTKLRDKAAVLDSVFDGKCAKDNHFVEIRYVPPAGDDKESWDCIHFMGWMGRPMSLRVNWQGADSFLAAPLILDILSSLIHAHRTGYDTGLIIPLGLFFKAPLGVEHYTFQSLLHAFHVFLKGKETI